MKCLQVKIPREDERDLQQFQDILHSQYKKLVLQGINYNIKWQMDQEWIQISCQFWVQSEYNLEIIENILELTSRSIAEFVVECKEKEILDEILNHEYGFEQSEIRADILTCILFVLNTDEMGEDCAELRKNWLKSKIAKKVSEYLWLENQLFLEGFIRFRLKEQWEDWRQAIEHGIEEYLMEKELRECTKQLQGIKQENNLPILHLIHIDDRNLLLFNEKWERLYPYLTNGISLQILGKRLHYQDLLMSVLLSLAPSLLIIHTEQESYHIIYSIKKIFKDNIQICSSCLHCQSAEGIAHPNSPFC